MRREDLNATLLSGTPFFARLPNEHWAVREALFSNFQRWSVVHLRALSSVTTKNVCSYRVQLEGAFRDESKREVGSNATQATRQSFPDQAGCF